MGTIRKTVTFTEQQDKWIKAQIEAGEFTNDSEYLRYLIRQDQSKNANFLAMKEAIQTGINSGVSKNSIPDIMKEVEERMKENGGL